MEFIMGDVFGVGMVGWMYYDMTGYLIARLLFGGMAILSIVGLVTIVGFIIRAIKGRKKETPGEKWLRTGRME